VFFGQETKEWGFDNKEIFDALTEARGLPTPEEQQPLYEDINDQVMEFLPGSRSHTRCRPWHSAIASRVTFPALCRTRSGTRSS
jgi:hypothetical protein